MLKKIILGLSLATLPTLAIANLYTSINYSNLSGEITGERYPYSLSNAEGKRETKVNLKSATLSIGFTHAISEKLSISPEFSYGVPLGKDDLSYSYSYETIDYSDDIFTTIDSGTNESIRKEIEKNSETITNHYHVKQEIKLDTYITLALKLNYYVNNNFYIQFVPSYSNIEHEITIPDRNRIQSISWDNNSEFLIDNNDKTPTISYKEKQSKFGIGLGVGYHLTESISTELTFNSVKDYTIYSLGLKYTF